MAYCQYCGTKLENGEVCTCEKAQAAVCQASAQQPQPQSQFPPQTSSVESAPASPSRTTSIVKGFRSYLGAYIANPAQAVQSVMDTDSLSTPVVLSVIRLLTMGLALYGLLQRTCDNALIFLTKTLSGFGNSGLLTASISASWAKSLIYGAIIAAVGMLLFMAVAFILVKFQGSSITFSKIFKANAANGILTSTLLLLSFLFSYVSTKFCIVWLALAMLSWIICGVLTIRVICPGSNSGVLWLTYFAGVVLIIVAGYYVVPPLFLQAAGGITVGLEDKAITLQNFFNTASGQFDKLLAEEGIENFGDVFTYNLKEAFQDIVSEIWYTLF